MLRLLIVFAILQLAGCACPSGFELISAGQCRGLYTTIPNLRYLDTPNIAISKCKEIMAQPIIIHNDEENLYWASKRSGAHNPVIGMMCNTYLKRWEWADGSAVDYLPRVHESVLDSSCNSPYSCVVQLDDSWYCSNETTSYTEQIYCITQLSPPVPSSDGCNSFEDDSEDGVCYQVGATAENWQDAQMICAQLGANLASIHNMQENSFVRRLAVSNGAVNGIFLGATTSGKGDKFGWIDGTEWDFENFHTGFPMPDIGDCVAMDTSTSSGLWMNIECSTPLPVACVRDQEKVVQPMCSDGPWKQDTIITSPGFPYHASTPCDFFLTVDAGKKVEVEIGFLEANTCCDFLVIHEGFLGGNMIANLTGEVRNVTYTSVSNLMRLTWEPNGGVNVRGMAFTYREV